MRIGLLSRNGRLYSTRRLLEAGEAHGHQMHLVDTMSIIVEMGQPDDDSLIKAINHRPHTISPSAWGYSNRALRYLPPFDAIIPRIGTTITEYGLAVVRQFEDRGVAVTTAASRGIAQSRDKLVSLQLMSQAGIPVPKTAVIENEETLGIAMRAIGGPPAILKLVNGTQGRGVILVRDLPTAVAVLRKLRRITDRVLLQEFFPEAKGKDLRVLIVGDECVAVMQRQAPQGDFRANLHLGGTAVSIPISEQVANLAIQVAQLHGLGVGGVDLIQTNRGFLVLEVNSSPGLEGIENATGKDIADSIISYLEKQKHAIVS